MSAFVCRDDAVAAVTEMLARPPALVLVEGEAGSGKTRLVRECLRSGLVVEQTVLLVACPPLAESASLGPVIDGLRRLRDSAGGVQLSALGGALRALFPEWAADLPPALEPLGDAAATRHRVYRALDELIDRLRVDVVVLEDAHWADPGTLEWLLRTGADADRGRTTVVTYRPEDVPAGSLLWRLTSRMPAGMRRARVVLEPLDVPGIVALTGSMFGGQVVSNEFASLLRERTGGLPLAVEECLRLLRERGDIERRGQGWARRALAEIRVPPTVRDSVLERVDRLDPAARRVLEAAAVLGEPEPEPRLAAVAGLDPPAGRLAVAAGLRSGLLGGADLGRVGFRHRLAAEAVEAAVPASERRRLHQRAAEVLQAGGEPSLARLSRHFREAGDLEAWAYYAEASADLAVETGDDHTAVTVLHELLTTVEHPGARRARLARKLGEAAASGAALLGARTEPLAETLQQVVAGDDIPAGQRGEIGLLLGRLLLWWPGHRQEAYERIEAAVADLADRPVLACQAMMLLGTPLVPDWPVRRHVRWVQQAAGQLPRVESRTARLSLAAGRARALLALGEESGWQAASQIPRPGPSLAERRAAADGLLQVGMAAVDWGRYAEARSRLDEAAELIEGTGYDRLRNIAQTACAYLDWCTGRWEGLGQAAARLAGAEETEPTTVRLHAQQIQGLVDLACGRREPATRRLRMVLEGYRQLELAGPEAATAAAALGRLYLADAAAEKAFQVTESIMAMISAKGVWLWACDVAPVHLQALVATGELGRAEDLAHQFTGWLAGRDAPAPAAASLLCRGIVAEARGGIDQAGGLYAQAAQVWAALPRPYDELRALERQACCLLAADDPGPGPEVLSDVWRRLQQLGARWDAGRVATRLRQHGIEIARRGRRGPRGHGDRLSPRELEIVALVAQGMTNPEVSRALFLSPKTVGNHLSRAMRKLQVSTRTSAAMAAAEAGLIPPAPERSTTP